MVSNLPGKGLDKLYITMNIEDFGLIFCHWNNNCNNNCKENTVAYVPVCTCKNDVFSYGLLGTHILIKLELEEGNS